MTLHWTDVVKAKDSLVNFMSGLGVPGRDKAASGGSFFNYVPLTQPELEAAYKANWLARKLIDIPAQDATRAWRAWQTDTNVVEALEEEEIRLNVQVVLKNAIIMSRLYGGSALLLGVNQGKAWQPLVLEKVGKGDLDYIIATSRHALGHGPVISDVMDPDYGKPEFFIRSHKGLQQAQGDTPLELRIHPSRVVILRGMAHADPIQSGEIWGDSILQNVHDAVQAATQVTQSVATLVTEAKFDIIKIPDLTQNIATMEYQNALTARFMYANSMKSIINTLILDKEEEWERVHANFTTLPDILQMYLLIVSGAADIPATRMLGQSPAGLQSTGESDVRNYYDRVNSDQVNILSPALATLDDVLIRSATGKRDPSLYYLWNPLWQLTGSEKADMAKRKADTFAIDASTALIDQEALRIGRQNQLIEDGVYPGLEQALEEQDQLDLESMVSAEEQAAQEEAEMRKQMAMGAAQNGFQKPQGAPQKGNGKGNGGSPFPARDARPVTAGRLSLRRRRHLALDYNPNPKWIKGEGGRFAGSEPGEGGGEWWWRREACGPRHQPRLLRPDPYQRTPRALPGPLEAMVRAGLYNPEDATKVERIRNAVARINKTALNYIRAGQGDSPVMQSKMRELRRLQTEMHELKADTGSFLGNRGMPGGPRDIVVIGGGPAGLSAAINGAYEEMDVLVVDKDVNVGGQSKRSSRLENFSGFTWGIPGDDLANRMHEQALKTGAEVRQGIAVTNISYDKSTGMKTVHLSNGEQVQTRAVIIAGGVGFKKLDVPGGDGPGVSYGDGAQLDRDTPKGGTAVIIGGSNGAAQAGDGISGKHIVVLARSPMSGSMSAKPQRALRTSENIDIIEGDELVRIERDDRDKIVAVVTKQGRRIKADAVGFFIGQAPETSWVPPDIERDGRGLIVSDPDFKTNVPGVYAVGDVRANGPQRVMTSGAEGQIVAGKYIFQWLAMADEAAKQGSAAPHAEAWRRHEKVEKEEMEKLRAAYNEYQKMRLQKEFKRAPPGSTPSRAVLHRSASPPTNGATSSTASTTWTAQNPSLCR